MGKLLGIEMRKMFKSAAFKIILVINCLLSLLSVFMYTSSYYSDNLLAGAMFDSTGYGVFKIFIADSSDIMMFTVICSAIAIGGDFAARTLQTQVVAGYSRVKIVLSRFFATVLNLVIMYMTSLLIMVIGQTITVGFGVGFTGEIFLEMLADTGLSLFMSVAIVAFYFFIIFTVKSTAAAIGISMPVMLIGVSIMQVLSVVYEGFKTFMDFTPYGQITKCMRLISPYDYIKFFAVGVVFILVFLFSTCGLFRRAELK